MLPWLLAASCVETVQTPAPATPTASVPTATDLLNDMTTAYAKVSSYEDHGDVTTAFTGSSAHTTKLFFQTAFVRSQRFRFEYRSDHEFRGRVLGSQRMVIWSDFSHTYSEWTVEPGIVDDGPKLALALGAAAGVSGGSSVTIPGLLLPDVVGRLNLRPRTPIVNGPEAVDGHPCWRVTGSDHSGDPLTLWIDRDTHLLRRLETSHHFGTFDADSTISYQPEIDQRIADAHLQPPDLTANPPTPRKPVPPSAWIGIWFENNTKKVRSVVPGGPAERAGLQVGDEIVAFNGQPLVDSSDVTAEVHRAGIGAHVTLGVVRGAAKLDIAVTLEPRKDMRQAARASLLDKPAPAFDLPVVVGGGPARLASLSGSVVILEFWSSSCAPCATQVPHLNELTRRYPALHVIGVSSDEPDEIRQFAKDNQVGYTLASDPDDKVLAAYWDSAFPMLVVIDKAGIVREVQVGAGSTSKLDDLVTNLLR